jgi:hypothetical protein
VELKEVKLTKKEKVVRVHKPKDGSGPKEALVTCTQTDFIAIGL